MVSSVKVTGILNQREMAGAPVARHLIDKARERGSREIGSVSWFVFIKYYKPHSG